MIKGIFISYVCNVSIKVLRIKYIYVTPGFGR
jgi:hypothetical protein